MFRWRRTEAKEILSMSATNSLRRAVATAICAASSVLLTGSMTAQGANLPLAAHRAVYDLTLLKSSGAKAPASARGRILFDFSGSSCDGYVQNFRQLTELQPSEGANRLSDMRSATFESGDASTYRFKIETKVDNATSEDIDGSVKKMTRGGLSGDLSKPKHAKINLAGPALFPTEHLRHILTAAQAGEPILEARVFDGTGDGQKIFDTMAVIGKVTTRQPSEKAAQIEQLQSLRRWPIAVSYFEPGMKDQQPAYVLSFDLYENGISRALKLDYGDFTLAGEMTELTILPTPPCKKQM
jgi:hypothetical protein